MPPAVADIVSLVRAPDKPKAADPAYGRAHA